MRGFIGGSQELTQNADLPAVRISTFRRSVAFRSQDLRFDRLSLDVGGQVYVNRTRTTGQGNAECTPNTPGDVLRTKLHQAHLRNWLE